MPALIGSSAPVALPLSLDQRELDALVAVLRGLVATRSETATNLAAYVAAVAACPLESFGFRELTAFVPPLPVPTNVSRMLVNSLKSSRWDDERLVEALCGCASADAVDAVVLEYEEVGPPKSAHAVLSIHALGAGFGTPLDFRRLPLDCDAHDERLVDLVCELLEVYRWHYADPRESASPPVVALAPQLGEYPRLRRAVAARVGEYGMLVDRGYSAERVVADMLEPRRPGAGLEAQLALSANVRPRRLRRHPNAPPDEFVVPFGREAAPQLAVVRPAVALPRDALRGRRHEVRARELGELLQRIQPPMVARTLRLDAVRHASHSLFRRHALLLSVLHALLTGRIAPQDTNASIS